MKKVKILLFMTIITIVSAFSISCAGTKDSELIEEFLNCWLQNSTANAELNHLMMEGATVIGIGAEEISDEEKVLREENSEAFDKLFEETYGKYMTGVALERFEAEQYSVCNMLFSEGVAWEIAQINIQEETESYWFDVEIIIDGNEAQRTVVQGRILMEDGVISELSDLQ